MGEIERLPSVWHGVPCPIYCICAAFALHDSARTGPNPPEPGWNDCRATSNDRRRDGLAHVEVCVGVDSAGSGPACPGRGVPGEGGPTAGQCRAEPVAVAVAVAVAVVVLVGG